MLHRASVLLIRLDFETGLSKPFPAAQPLQMSSSLDLSEVPLSDWNIASSLRNRPAAGVQSSQPRCSLLLMLPGRVQ